MIGPFEPNTEYLLAQISPELSQKVAEIQSNPQASDVEKTYAKKITQLFFYSP
jgi:hypothetical protein